MRRAVFLVLYCVFLLLACDFIYSSFFYVKPPPLRVRSPWYSHGSVPNFNGYDSWGYAKYRFFTNSLGFRDASVRVVAPAGPTRRILLIGDSFTEATGVDFEDSFAGLLYRAGLARADKVDVLNAGVASYSPVLYYAKIRHLIETGLRFDEVVVFSDISDVPDEAQKYFCFDEEPRYRALCDPQTMTQQPDAPPPSWHPRNNFPVTDLTLSLLKRKLLSYGADVARPPFEDVRALWTLPTFNAGNSYPPLGLEGGIERSRIHMQALADLLSQRGIPLSIVVYPWPMQLTNDDRDSRQARIWREFCVRNCKAFIDLFPAFFAVRDARQDWYERLFIRGDVHFSETGHRLVSDEVAKRISR